MAYLYPYIFGNPNGDFVYGTSTNANAKYAKKYTLNSDDNIYNLILNGSDITDPAIKLKGVIYSDNSGVPDALIAVTNEHVGLIQRELVVLSFSSPVFLTAGDYWLGFISDTYFTLMASGSGANTFYNTDTYSDGPSDPFGSYSTNTYERMVYAAGEAIPITGLSVANAYAVISPPVSLILSNSVAYSVLKEAQLGNNRFLRNPNCIALYRFEDFEIGIDSKGTNDLTASASSPTAFSGEHKEGNFAVDFDDTNSQYLYITDANLSSNFPYKGGTSNFDFTICVWARFNTVATWDKDHIIVSKGRTAFSLGLIRSASPQLTMYLDSDGYTVSTPLEQDKWYHISVAYDVDSNYLQIRIWDYTSDSLHSNTTPAVNINLVANTNEFRIGSAVGDTDYADISLDELVIFNKALGTEDMDLIRQGIYTFADVKPMSMVIV